MPTEQQKALLLAAAQAIYDQDDVHLDMSDWRKNSHGDSVPQDSLEHPCGTCGCFLGNAPFLGIKGLEFTSEDINKYYHWNKVSFWDYGHRVFGVHDVLDPDVWTWLFGSKWDNSKENMLNRVKYYVQNDAVPSGCYSSLFGDICKYPDNWEEIVKEL